MRYLGIDYGKRKIGLAISEGLTTSPLTVVDVNGIKDAITKINKIVEIENINKLIIGISESGESYKLVKAFINEYKRVFPDREIVEFDETLSSQEALREMIELSKSKKERGREDAYSAAILLQNYLESKE
jgi:putative transcription antitermination factor YqgF